MQQLQAQYPSDFSEDTLRLLPGVPVRLVDLIVVHCSATPSGKPIATGRPGQVGYQDAAHVINSWHAVRGFKRSLTARLAFNGALTAIGYHYVIDLDGRVLAGRHRDEIPAQATGFNAHAIGICLVGGAEREGRFTVKQWDSLAQLACWLLALYELPAAPPERTPDAGADMGYRVHGGICGHRDLSPDLDHDGAIESREWLKTCPGFDVKAWLDNRMQPLPQHVCEEVAP